MEAELYQLRNFISELASLYLPIEQGPEAAELILLRLIMEARVIEREFPKEG